MTKRQDASKLVKSGMSPSLIAETWNDDIRNVRMYLLEQIAERELTGSDVLLSLSKDTKDAYDDYIQKTNSSDYWVLVNGSSDAGFGREQFRLYLDCRDSLRRDLYALIADLEVFLHQKIRDALIAEYGKEETEWWRIGVPEAIRIACVSTRETDPYPPGEPYCYTTFIHLSKIIDKNWQVFHFRLPERIAADRKELGRTFNRLNAVRNAVMHPVKKEHLSEDDYLFTLDAATTIGSSRTWRG